MQLYRRSRKPFTECFARSYDKSSAVMTLLRTKKRFLFRPSSRVKFYPMNIKLFIRGDEFDRTRSFYADGLGLTEEIGHMGAIVFRVHPQIIELIPLPVPLAETRTGISFHVSDLKRCVDYLVKERYIAHAPLDSEVSRTQIIDPSGNRITLIQM